MKTNSQTIHPLHGEVLREIEAFHKSEARILDLLQKIDSERLYLELAYPSLFKYAVGYLKLTEAQAYAFMTVARKAREIPQLKTEIDNGNLSVSKARRIVPVIETSNQNEWIDRAKTLSKSELERQVAQISPHAFKKREVIRALSASDSSVRFQISEEKLKNWKRMQTLMISKKRKTMDLMGAIDALVEDFLKKEDPLRKEGLSRGKKALANGNFGNAEARGKYIDNARRTVPGPGQGKLRQDLVETSGRQSLHTCLADRKIKVVSRNISRAVRRQALQRDRAQCQYRAPTGRVCGNEIFLQLHHHRPWALGGRHDINNLQVLCAAHHRFKHEAAL